MFFKELIERHKKRKMLKIMLKESPTIKKLFEDILAKRRPTDENRENEPEQPEITSKEE